MLTLNDVGRRFAGGTVALEGITLRIAAGDFLVLLGPSGCGKSTLLRLIAGLDRPDTGGIAWDAGKPPPGAIGFVFQDATLLPWASAAANVALPLRLRGETDLGRAHEALRQVGLEGFEAARPAALSGGMRMRVSIARALVMRPQLLLMDEPFAALDEPTRHGLQARLRDLAHAAGCTVVFVTHSLYEAAYLARRVAVLTPRPGRLAHLLELGEPPAARLDEDYMERLRTIAEAGGMAG